MICVSLFLFWLFGFDNDSIFVISYCCDDVFNYEIKHKRVAATGETYTFKPYQSQDDLFGGLKETFEVFQEEDNAISLIYNDHIYTIKRNLNEKNVYDLYGEHIVYEYEKGSEVYSIPFPIDQLLEPANGIPRTSNGYLKIKEFNREVYRNFYSVYQDIEVTENTIRGKDFILIYEGNALLKINVDK